MGYQSSSLLFQISQQNILNWQLNSLK